MPDRIEQYLKSEFFKTTNRFTLQFSKDKNEQLYQKTRLSGQRAPTDVIVAMVIFLVIFTGRRITTLVSAIFRINGVSSDPTIEIGIFTSWGIVMVLEIIIAQIQLLNRIRGCLFMLHMYIGVIYASWIYYNARPVLSPLYSLYDI